MVAQAANEGVGPAVLFGALIALAGAFGGLVYWVLNMQERRIDKTTEILTAIRALTAQMDAQNQLKFANVFKHAGTSGGLAEARDVLREQLEDIKKIDPEAFK